MEASAARSGWSGALGGAGFGVVEQTASLEQIADARSVLGGTVVALEESSKPSASASLTVGAGLFEVSGAFGDVFRNTAAFEVRFGQSPARSAALFRTAAAELVTGGRASALTSGDVGFER